MRYRPDLVKKILRELEKVPNVRYVCKKFGIDHSTFYRWRLQHNEFQAEVLNALGIGREAINDAAEAVIIKGVQDGQFKCASFWLSHNNLRYMPKAKGEQYFVTLRYEMWKLRRKKAEGEVDFEDVFKAMDDIREKYGDDSIERLIRPVIEIICEGDKELMDVLRADYEHRVKQSDIETKHRIEILKNKDELESQQGDD